MDKSIAICLVIFGLCFSYHVRSLKLIPERAYVKYLDKFYLGNVTINVRRNGRGGDYVVNLFAESRHTWANNVSINVLFYEYLHNEYRASFIELHFKFCDFVLKDKIFGEVVRRVGIRTCPYPAGIYNLTNMIFNENVPSVWPFEKGMLELTMKDDIKQKVMGKGQIMFKLTQNFVKKY